ncbi:MAG: DUF3127 domain-containing protein [Cyclobacteriaceae bacterium]|jgi:hypothetical protein|nr:DUF3127 domain-containing protein [Flammeovirgaceae bacterium]MCZ8022712.1 DUF3127 domain-containing protein [Cytophagales bacterium]MCZ8327418.1 DUF3127 domain-containing protein [Cyclobacteriaceae bacterium]
MDVKGKVIQILPEQSGAGKKGTWRKQEFIVETQSQYPKKVCLSMWGDKIQQFNIAVGQMVQVSVDLESREYNGRWYTEARAWKIEKQGQSNEGYDAPPAYDTFDSPASSTSSDDLPF